MPQPQSVSAKVQAFRGWCLISAASICLGMFGCDSAGAHDERFDPHTSALLASLQRGLRASGTRRHSLQPIVNCVAPDGSGNWFAHFGYINARDTTLTLPIGPFNTFAPAPLDRGQSSLFLPGENDNVVVVPLGKYRGPVAWILDGRLALAWEDSPPCIPSFAGASSASAVSATEVLLTWAQATDSTTPAPGMLYDICVSATSGSCGTDFVVSRTITGEATSTVMTGLASGMTYYFVVRARNGYGIEDQNQIEVSAQTPVVCRSDCVQSVGEASACVVTAGGGLECWGHNSTGQLGNGSNIDSWFPTPVSGLESDVAAVSMGSLFACALTTRGSVECWGDNSVGELGDGSTTSRAVPAPVLGLASGVTVLSVNTTYACAVVAHGVECWGMNAFTNSAVPVAIPGLENGVTSVSVGRDFACALTADGGVKCWGNNFQGQLGDNSTTNRSSPVQVTGLADRVTAISAGDSSACAVTAAGSIECWGDNSQGQLGNDSPSNSSVAVQVLGPAGGAVAVSVGSTFACAIDAGGGVECWGDNTYGELGAGERQLSRVPIQVANLSSGVSAISAGTTSVCAVTARGVECWGDDTYGELGIGDPSTLSYPLPVEVTGLIPCAGSPEAGICVGCPDGQALCNGVCSRLDRDPYNCGGCQNVCASYACASAKCCAAGEVVCDDLCTSTMTDAANCGGCGNACPSGVDCVGGTCACPSNTSYCGGACVSTLTDLNHCGSCENVCPTGAACIDGHCSCPSGTTTCTCPPNVLGCIGACSVLTNDWLNCGRCGNRCPFGGVCNNGQCECPPGRWLCDGVDCLDLSSDPLNCGACHQDCTGSGSLRVYGQTCVGGACTCSTPDYHPGGGCGDALSCRPTNATCMGSNARWMCPAGTNRICGGECVNASSCGAPLTGVVSVSMGENFACALLQAGTVACWGRNNYGQLGNGRLSTGSSTAVMVSNLNNVIAIAAGRNFACALLQDRTVSCWGYNRDGQLGDGTTNTSASPVPVSNLSGVAAIFAGSSSACAILEAGTVECWGANPLGQLGNGTIVSSSSPVVASNVNGATTIVFGSSSTYALLSDHTVMSWGDNAQGQLGDGTTVSSSSPVAVSQLNGVTAVSAGMSTACALFEAGTVACWGQHLGSAATNVTSPVTVPNLNGVTQLSMAGYSVCAVLQAGTVECWGSNRNGELGNGTTVDSEDPVVVSGLNDVIAIADDAPGSSPCALLQSGAVECWAESRGSTPVEVLTTPYVARSVSSRAGTSCAVLSDSTIACSGANTYGEVGNGEPPSRPGAATLVVVR